MTKKIAVTAPRKNTQRGDNAAPVYADAITEITGIIRQAQTWEAKELSASNTSLYKIMAKCMLIYEKMSGDSQVFYTDALNHLIKEQGQKFRSSTHIACKIAGVVFFQPEDVSKNDGRADRRKSSHYGRVLVEALAKGRTSLNIEEWLRQNGGINGIINKQRDRKEKTAVDKKNPADALLKGLSKIKLTESPISVRSPDMANSGPVVMICSQSARNTFEVHQVLQDKDLVKRIVMLCERPITKTLEDYNTNHKDVDEEAIKKKAVAEALTKMKIAA